MADPALVRPTVRLMKSGVHDLPFRQVISSNSDIQRDLRESGVAIPSNLVIDQMHRNHNRLPRHLAYPRRSTTTPSSSTSRPPTQQEVRQSAPVPVPDPGHEDAATAVSPGEDIGMLVQGDIVGPDGGNVGVGKKGVREKDVVNVN